MARGEMLPIQHAARALGVPDDQLRRLVEQGSIPGAINREDDWLIPTSSLMAIARRQGVPVELAVLRRELDDDSISRIPGDVLAAQAAVLLAKTQATAARVESRSLLQRLRRTAASAEADRAARREAAESVTGLRAELEAARREAAVAEAKLAEIRERLSSEEGQLEHLVERIAELEQERARLTRSLGWLGRRRYGLLVDQESPARPRAFESAPDTARELTAPDQATDVGKAIAAASESEESGPPLYELPDVGLPVWRPEADTAEADGAGETDADLYHLPDPMVGADPLLDVEAGTVSEAARPGGVRDQNDHGFPQPPNLKVHRTADGRFDRANSAAIP